MPPPHADRVDMFRMAVYGLVLAYVWRVQDLFPALAALQFPLIMLAAALAIGLANPKAVAALGRVKSPTMLLSFGILLLMAASVPASLYPGRSFSYILDDHIKTIVMMVLVLVSIRGPRDVLRLGVVHLMGAVMYSIVVNSRFEIGPSGRLAGLYYYDANDLGMLLVSTLPFAAYLARHATRVSGRLFAIGAALLCLMTIVRTGSRGAFVGFVAVALYMVLAYRGFKPATRLAGVVGAVVLLGIFGGATYRSQMATLLNLKDDYNWSGNADDGRMEIWKRGVGYMLRRPVTGVGVQAFPMAEGTLSPLAYRQEMNIGVRWAAAHNSFVQIGAELGVGGLLLYVLTFVVLIRELRRVMRVQGRGPPGASVVMAQTLIAATVGYAVCAFFLSQAYAAYWYCMLAIANGYLAVAPRGQQVVEQAPSPRARASGPWFRGGAPAPHPRRYGL